MPSPAFSLTLHRINLDNGHKSLPPFPYTIIIIIIIITIHFPTYNTYRGRQRKDRSDDSPAAAGKQPDHAGVVPELGRLQRRHLASPELQQQLSLQQQQQQQQQLQFQQLPPSKQLQLWWHRRGIRWWRRSVSQLSPFPPSENPPSLLAHTLGLTRPIFTSNITSQMHFHIS